MSTTEETENKAAADNEMDRLKALETANGGIKKALDAQMQKNQQNEQTFIRLSAMLGELLAVNARTTYIATMIKDIIDGRNLQQ